MNRKLNKKRLGILVALAFYLTIGLWGIGYVASLFGLALAPLCNFSLWLAGFLMNVLAFATLSAVYLIVSLGYRFLYPEKEEE